MGIINRAIKTLRDLNQDRDFTIESMKKCIHVRIIQDKTLMGKKRSNLSPNAYLIDSRIKNKYIIKAKDGSVSEYPRYRLVPDTKAKLADTISNGKRGIVNHIESFNRNKYKVRFNDGSTDTLTIKKMREGRPTKLSPQELEYWSKNKSFIPSSIKDFLYHSI